MSLRRFARELFLNSVSASSIADALERRLALLPGGFACAGHSYLWDEFDAVRIVAAGKAAAPMTRGFLARVAPPRSFPQSALVVGTRASEELPAGCAYIQGGHPQPSAGSLEAARRISAALEPLGERDLVIFLISGGGSAMVEQFLNPALSLDEISSTHRALVESGASIDEINAVRKHLSAVKGGRLARLAAPARQLTLLVSDVPPGRLDALASGPTLPDATSLADARAALERHSLGARLPPRVLRLLDDPRAESLKADDPAFARSAWELLLDSSTLAAHAQAAAAAQGWHAAIDNGCDDWQADAAADYLLERLAALRRSHGRACLISAGEITVKVAVKDRASAMKDRASAMEDRASAMEDTAGAHGSGGRNQHFALLCAQRIAGSALTVLSAGSDGIDGNSPAAGAVVDGSTRERAQARGLDLASALERFDSHALLDALGDAIVTGPTGNNLRDLRILLAP